MKTEWDQYLAKRNKIEKTAKRVAWWLILCVFIGAVTNSVINLLPEDVQDFGDGDTTNYYEENGTDDAISITDSDASIEFDFTGGCDVIITW